MTPLEQLRADLTRAYAKLGRMQGHPHTQTHTLDLFSDILLLLNRYASALLKADVDRRGAPDVAGADLPDPRSRKPDLQPPASPQPKHQ